MSLTYRGLLTALAVVSAGSASAQTWAPSSDQPATAAASGFSSSLALAGNELYIGRTGGFGVGTGDVMLYRRAANGRWSNITSFTAKGLTIGDGFASAMALDGTWLAVGAPNGARGGAVYLFQRSGQAWREASRLALPDSTPGARFGASLAMKNGTLIVGVPGVDSARGAAYVYRRSPQGRWSAATLLGTGDTASARFGTSVALDRTRAVVGMPGLLFGGPSAQRIRGSVVVYEAGRTGTWAESARIAPAEDSVITFGGSVHLDGDNLTVGAPGMARNMGSVFLFTRSTGGWGGELKIAPPEDMPFQVFGMSVLRSGKQLFVGAPFTRQGLGAVHVFRQEPDGWFHNQTLAEGVSGFIQFGGQLALAGDVLVIGAPGADFGEGTAYVMGRDADGLWRQRTSLMDQSTPMAAVENGELKCENGKAAGFDCGQVDLVSFVPTKELGASRGIRLNDIWGWTDPETNHEYALVGRMDGTAFVDVTDAARPVYLGDLPMHEGAHANVWRDIKVYKDHAFIVADGAGPHGMQVFDLARLRHVTNAPTTFTEDAHYDRIASAHNIVINEETGFAYTVGNSGGGETCGGALHMINIQNPKQPVFAGCHADPATGLQRTGYTHDAQCVVYHGPDQRYKGREICFNASETAVGIADVTDKANPKKVAVANYPNTAYAHQGWLNEAQTHFFLDDEGDEIQGTTPRTRTLIWDVTNLEEPVLVKEFMGETSASDHNLYIRGNYMYQSNYVAGLRIVDVSNPVEPREVAYFDTVPVGDNAPGFAGSWSNYPYFKSGTIIVTSVREGLFMVRHRPPQPAVP